MEEKYRRPDIEGGYIYDKNDIEYYKATQRNDVIDNGLLGDYNMVGAYVVNNAIVEELLKIKKVYTDSFGKSIFCESLKLFDGKPIKFRLNINSGVPTHTKVTASLELMEDIKRVNGFYTNTNIVLLASKVYDDKKDVNKKIFKDFNISQINRDESGAKVENNFDVRNILLRLDTLKDLKESAVPVNARLEKMLFEKRMKVLLSSPKCAPLIEEFNRQIFHCRDKFLIKSDKNYYRYINQVLDTVLEMRGFELTDKDIWKQLKEIGMEYSKTLNQSLDMVYANQEKLDELRHAKDFKKVENKVKNDVVQNQEKKEETKKPEEKQEKTTSTPSSSGGEKPTSKQNNGAEKSKKDAKEKTAQKNQLGSLLGEAENLNEDETETDIYGEINEF